MGWPVWKVDRSSVQLFEVRILEVRVCGAHGWPGVGYTAVRLLLEGESAIRASAEWPGKAESLGCPACCGNVGRAWPHGGSCASIGDLARWQQVPLGGGRPPAEVGIDPAGLLALQAIVWPLRQAPECSPAGQAPSGCLQVSLLANTC